MSELIVGAGLIDRRKAVNEVDRFAGYLDDDMIYRIKYALAGIHVADVQPVVHGRWIETEEPMEWDNVSCATCSVCGEDFVLDEWGIDDVRREMHYCLNCGAKMDLEDE